AATSRLAYGVDAPIPAVPPTAPALVQPAAPPAAQPEPLQLRLEAINQRLSRLEEIQSQLRKLRQEELPKLQHDAQARDSQPRDLAGTTETSVLVGGQADKGQADKSAEKPLVKVAEKPVDPTVTPPATAPTPAAAGDAAAQNPIELKLQEIEARLRMLDDIAQQLSALRNEDLPKLQKGIRGTKETSARVEKSTPNVDVAGKVGKLVIENVSPFVRDVSVNGKLYRFSPGAWSVDVPLSAVTTQMGAADVIQEWSTDFWKQTERGPEMRLQLR
ncbi:MAG: hypothetical protein K8T25_04080, partial [Planctomycetia bacterium]|nr:hypothetical protein [Planctomycetia bacterium]